MAKELTIKDIEKSNADIAKEIAQLGDRCSGVFCRDLRERQAKLDRPYHEIISKVSSTDCPRLIGNNSQWSTPRRMYSYFGFLRHRL